MQRWPDKHNIQITSSGKFTCDYCVVDNDDMNTYVYECPEFDTIEEVQKWIKDNVGTKQPDTSH